MTIKEAFERVPKEEKLIIGDAYFAMLRWEHPDGTGAKSDGPHLVTLCRDVAIEVTSDGGFSQFIMAECDGYFPYLSRVRKERKAQMAKFAKQLLDRIAA